MLGWLACRSAWVPFKAGPDPEQSAQRLSEEVGEILQDETVTISGVPNETYYVHSVSYGYRDEHGPLLLVAMLISGEHRRGNEEDIEVVLAELGPDSHCRYRISPHRVEFKYQTPDRDGEQTHALTVV